MKESRSSFTTSQIEGICWFAWTVWENLFYSSYLSTGGTYVHLTQVIHTATQCCARMGKKLLSELVMIKSNIKPQPVYSHMFHWQWQFIDSEYNRSPTYYWCLEINVMIYMLLHFKSTEAFEIWVLVLVFVFEESVLPW